MPQAALSFQPCVELKGNPYDSCWVAGKQASQSGDADAGPAPKKRKTAVKPYCPQLGTANYAFLIVLYRVRCETWRIWSSCLHGLNRSSVVGAPLYLALHRNSMLC